MEPTLVLMDMGFGYGKERILKHISFQVHPGEIIGILGPNGSGKSTLLKLMDGILVPQEGKILTRGQDMVELKRSDLAKEIAMVSQENHFQFAFSVLEVVLMGRFPHLGTLRFEGKRDLDVALEALEATHTLHFAGRSIGELSGGEKQRVLIARALAQEPKVLLLDEPTSFLDLKYKRDMFLLISALGKRKGLSVIVVSHDIDLVAQYCDRILLLKEGVMHKLGDPAVVITAADIEAVYDCPVHVDRNPADGKPRVSVI